MDYTATTSAVQEKTASQRDREIDHRQIFTGQARLLAARAERNLPIDTRSVYNLLCTYLALLIAEERA